MRRTALCHTGSSALLPPPLPHTHTTPPPALCTHLPARMTHEARDPRPGGRNLVYTPCLTPCPTLHFWLGCCVVCVCCDTAVTAVCCEQPMFSALELFALAFRVPIFNEVGDRVSCTLRVAPLDIRESYESDGLCEGGRGSFGRLLACNTPHAKCCPPHPCLRTHCHTATQVIHAVLTNPTRLLSTVLLGAIWCVCIELDGCLQ